MRNWSKLDHENVVKFEGFLFDDQTPPHATIVSDWADGGTADDYVKKHPECNQLKLVRIQYLDS